MTLKSIALLCVVSLINSFSFAADQLKPLETQVIDIDVNVRGFFPNIVQADPGKLVILKFTRKTKDTCATTVEIPLKKIKRKLPLNKTVTIKVGLLEPGEVKFGCAVGKMENGIIYVK